METTNSLAAKISFETPSKSTYLDAVSPISKSKRKDAVRISSKGEKMRRSSCGQSIIKRRPQMNLVKHQRKQKSEEIIPRKSEDEQMDQIIQLLNDKGDIAKKKNNSNGILVYQKKREKIEELLELKNNLKNDLFSKRNIIFRTKDELQNDKLSYLKKKEQKQNKYTEVQKQIYNFISASSILQDEIKTFQIQNRQAQRKFDENATAFKKCQSTIENTEKERNFFFKEKQELFSEVKYLDSSVKKQQFHISILKFQFNFDLRIGFVPISEGISKTQVFNLIRWEKDKQKKMKMIDIKYHIILQLYEGWKKIVKNLSFQSSYYEVLLGESVSIDPSSDYSKYILSDRPDQKKKKVIIFCNENPERKTHFKAQIGKMLQNFDNKLIQIYSVNFLKINDETEELQITYNYQGNEIKVSTFTVQFRTQVTKQWLLKIFRSSDCRAICLIEIPLLCTKQQFEHYSEIYEMIRKNKKI